MRCPCLFPLLLSALISHHALGQGAQPLLRYEKGEVIPVLALAFDKSGPHEYILRLPPNLQGLSGEALKKRLEKELQSLAGLDLKWRGSDLVLRYQGPDTPLIQMLARISIEPHP